eukprot:gene1967-biopygen14801
MLKGEFNQPPFADLRLVLRSSLGGSCTSGDLASDSPPSKRLCTGLSSDDERSFSTHKVILASNSPVIKAMLLRAKELRNEQALGDGFRVRVLLSPPAQQQTDHQLEILKLPMEHEELLACEVLLRSMYSGDLAEEVRSALSREQGAGVHRVTLLVQVYRLADRLEVCTDQCAQAISALSSAECGSVDVANYVFSLRAAPALVEHVIIKALEEKCLSHLVSRFGEIREVFWRKSAEFRELDFLTVLALFASDELVVDSENEILTLMGLWMGKDWADRISKEQLGAFWDVLRLGHLTASFISNLAIIAPWLPVDPVVLGHAATWKCHQFKNPGKAAFIKKMLQSAHGSSVAWFKDQRKYGSKKTFVLSVGFEYETSACISAEQGIQTLAHVEAALKLGKGAMVRSWNVHDFLCGTQAWEVARVDVLDDFSCLGSYLDKGGNLPLQLYDMLKGEFNQPAFADLRLVLRSSQGGSCTSSDLASDSPPSKRRCTGLSSDDERSFNTHKVILASNSPVIKAMLLRAKELRDLQALGDGFRVRLHVSPPAQQQTDPQLEILELPMEHEELLACEVLFRSIYSGDLAEEVRSALSREQGAGVHRVTLLVQVYRLADRLEVCTDQCAQAISALSSAECESVDVANFVFSLKRAAPALVEHVIIKALEEKCLSHLVARFKKIKEVFWSDALIDEFKQLDFLTVLAFFESDKLVVESENDILALMSLWMGEDWADRISKEQLGAFWNVLRLGHFTTSFISNLAIIAPWLPVDPVMLGYAATWKCHQFKNPREAASIRKMLQSAHGMSVAWFKDRRMKAKSGMLGHFSFSKDDLASLLSLVQHSEVEEDLHTIRGLGSSTFNGYDFRAPLSVQLLSDGPKKAFVLSVGFEYETSAYISTEGIQTLAHVKAECELGKGAMARSCDVHNLLCGTHAWEVARVDMLDDFSCLGSYLDRDGNLPCELTIWAIN